MKVIICYILFVILYMQLVACFLDFKLPSDLSCESVSKRDKLNLYDCLFIDNNSTHILCDIYAEIFDNSSTLPVQIVLSFKTVFYLKPSETPLTIDGEDGWWCLGIKSSKIEKIPQMPKNASNRMTFPKETSVLFTSITSAVAIVKFDGNAATGFVKFKQNCHPSQQPMRNDCIAELKGSTYAVAPGSDDITIYDILFNKIFELYFKKMGGEMEYLALSTTFTGVFSSYWMELLKRTNVHSLNASNNYFDGVLPDRFGNLEKLTNLEMRNCKLKGIHQANFAGTPNLEILDLCGNMFATPPNQISTLRKLRILNMCSQKEIRKFRLGNELVELMSLKELKLVNLPLIDLDKSHLPVFLELLDISYCQLSSLKSDIFSSMLQLKRVVLTGNLLSTLHPSTFSLMPPGASIILSKNLFREGQNLSLQNASVLDMSNNHLKTPENILKNGLINSVDLSSNDIVNWTSKFVFNLNDSSILHLNLSYNSIPVIETNMAYTLNTLKSVDIGGNQFDCQDCSLIDFQNWINKTKKTNILLLNKSDELIRCVLPPRQKGQLLIEAEYNKTSCLEKPPNFKSIAGISVGILILLCLISLSFMYLYRYEISYARHLYNIKKTNENPTLERSACKYDVFVSYCSIDRDWVMDVLLSGLENPIDKYVLCLHERDFRLGAYIMDNVVECIDKSRRTLLVLTNNYINSQWCKWELQMAQHRVFEDCTDFLILLELEKLDRATLPTHLRVLMSTRTYLEWPNPAGDINALRNFWIRLKEVLGKPLADTPHEEEENVSDDDDISQYSDSELINS